MPDTSKHLFPTKQICERYGVTVRTLDRWLADDRMKFPRPMIINRRKYFNEADIEVWERSRATAKPLEAA